MVRLLQGIASIDATITRRLIVRRFTETEGRYIYYLSLPQLVTVLDSTEHQNRRSQLHVWRQYTMGRLGYGTKISA